MYAIAGATGHTGRVVAETLLAKGQPIRVVVRDENKGAPWKQRGAEIAVANLDDEAAVARALNGAKGAYVLLPPDPITTDFFGSRAKMIDAIGRAAASAGLPHLVFLSSIGAHVPKGHGPIGAPYQGERSFEKLGIGTTFVRAAYFLENYGGVLPAAKKDGVLPSFLPANFTHSVVTTTDIGRTAAQALLDGPRGRRVIELSGPADVTPADIAVSARPDPGAQCERRGSAARRDRPNLHVVRDVAAHVGDLPRDVRGLPRRRHHVGGKRGAGSRLDRRKGRSSRHDQLME